MCIDPQEETYFTSNARRRDTKIDFFFIPQHLRIDCTTEFFLQECVGPDHHPGLLKLRIDLGDILEI